MAFQFTDTFCTITSVSQAPYEATSGTITYSSAYARFAPPSGCQGGGVSIGQYLRKNLSGNLATLIGFCSYGAPALPGSLNSGIIGFLDNGTIQTFLAVTASGALQFYRGGSGGSNIAIGPSTASGLISTATLPVHGVEVVVTFSTTVGQVQCWLDGNQVINSSANLNTSNSGNAYANQVEIGGYIGNTNAGMYTDYLRVWDSTGSSQNAALGTDRQPVTKLPSGAGTNTHWTPNGLGTNHACVAVVPPNTSDYVSANGTAVIDDYAMPFASLVGAPSQVVAVSYYQKTDSNTRTYTNGVLSSGTAGTGTTFTANSGLTWVQNCIALNPNGSAVWTAGTADAAHFYHEEVT